MNRPKAKESYDAGDIISERSRSRRIHFQPAFKPDRAPIRWSASIVSVMFVPRRTLLYTVLGRSMYSRQVPEPIFPFQLGLSFEGHTDFMETTSVACLAPMTQVASSLKQRSGGDLEIASISALYSMLCYRIVWRACLWVY